MNQDQIMSYIRSALKIGGALLMAHGYAKAGGMADQLLNMPDVIGFLATGIGLLMSHFTHASSDTASGNPKTPVWIWVLAALALSLPVTGCNTTPQRVTYEAAATTTVTVETAIKAYNVYVAGKTDATTIAHNQAVKVAYLKYQAAAAVVCDAGKIYAATSATNAPAANEALDEAVADRNATIADVINLVKSFGVKL